MDPDLVMQRLISGLVFLGAAAAAGVLATWLVGWFCRRAHLPRGLTLLAQVLTPVAFFYAGSLYLDAAGVVAPRRSSRRTRAPIAGANGNCWPRASRRWPSSRLASTF